MAAELIAGAFLSSFFQFTLQRFSSSDFKDIFHKGLVEKLEITLNSINQLLDDAKTKQYQNQNVKNWLDQIKHEIYEVDKLLDEVATNVKRRSKVRRFLSAKTNNQFGSRIKDLLDKLEHLANQKGRLGLKIGKCARNELEVGPKSSIRIPMTSLVDESSIFGRKGDKEKIINFLLSDNGSSNHAPIISIVGLGGMGKTTLAQLVYNDHMIQKSFELKAWVYVSEFFDVVGLTKAILESFGCSPTSETLETLQRQLQERLTGKKYLLVLDDVWNGNVEIWEHLQLPLNKGSSESKIIVTTRNKEVASSMKSSMLLDLERLEESDCWSLFVKFAFHNINVRHPILESIGKNIVIKCGGLPLAVKSLGNLLRRKFSQSEWVRILETDMWCLPESDNKINPVLRLSYHNLPSNLKRCFAYCSIFPKGYQFEKNTLINLWKAEGLLNCCRGEKSEEELGNELFKDLESISFLQQSLDSQYDTSFVMHDLVNDLAKSESQKFCLQIESDTVQDISEKTRHIWCSLDLNDDARISKQICQIKGLRSLLVEGIMISNNLQCDIFSKLKYLRMLSFRGCELYELADKIGNLKFLRYLDLTKTKIKSLPDSICKLYSLETLILERTDIKKMPKKIGSLNHLQTLSHFVVGENSGSDIKELNNLNLLQGKLCISGLKYVINPANVVEANMKDKKHLEELIVHYSVSFEVNNPGRGLNVLEALQPNSNLKKLTIKNYNGNRFPNWLRDFHLPNLVSLKLESCELCLHLPPLGQLPCLKELSISHCDRIKIVGEDFYDNNSTSVLPFRSLEFLEFEKMDNWEEWLCFEGFPLLKKLCIRECPKLKRVLPQNFPSLQELKISGCHKLEECLCLEGSPLLENVSIRDCSKLKRVLPQHLPSLQKLKIVRCKMMEASIRKGDSMIELVLWKCYRILVNGLSSRLKKFVLWKNRYTEFSVELNLVNCSVLEELEFDLRGFVVKRPSLDLRCYNSLRDLSIRGCNSSSLPFSLHLFTNLHSLSLYDCPQLESFPRGCLPSTLSGLEIQNCPKVIASREKWGLFQLNSLKSLRVSDEFEKVESFPEENLLPPTLEYLALNKCSKLRIINNKGFLHLNSLNHLYIWNCPSIKSLPEEGLPSSLSLLNIDECPLISNKYKKEGGERWHTIRHIPIVNIDFINQHE
ncbi:putative disease resistance RPP13 protein [Trifolium repens]|nr:putative disease resistance RPP13 protein [Trifolium repens]